MNCKHCEIGHCWDCAERAGWHKPKEKCECPELCEQLACVGVKCPCPCHNVENMKKILHCSGCTCHKGEEKRDCPCTNVPHGTEHRWDQCKCECHLPSDIIFPVNTTEKDIEKARNLFCQPPEPEKRNVEFFGGYRWAKKPEPELCDHDPNGHICSDKKCPLWEKKPERDTYTKQETIRMMADCEEKIDKIRTREREFRKEVLDTFELLEKKLDADFTPTITELRERFL